MRSLVSDLVKNLRAERARAGREGGEARLAVDLTSTERAGRWLLALALVLAPLAIGSLHTYTTAILAAVASGAAVLVHWRVEPRTPRVVASTLVLVAMALTAYTALQAVPLPAAVVRLLAPETADVWARSLSPLREPGPSWVTLSLDPVATRVEVLRGVVYIAILVAGLRVAHHREGAVFLERTLVASCLLMAITAVLHPAFGAERVFGAYKPLVDKSSYFQAHLSPLLNTNHLAAFVNIGFAIAVGAALTSRDGSVPRFAAIACAVVLASITLWCRSRGGVLSIVVSVLAAANMSRAARRDRTGGLIGAVVGVIGIAGGAMFIAGMFNESVRVLGEKDFSKLGLIREAFKLVAQFPVFGTGRGAFESVFPSMGHAADNWVHTHPENVFAQWFSEWGVPVAVLSMLLLVYALSPGNVLMRSIPPVGPWSALAGALVHNTVDFSSEVPGIMIAFVTCAAIVTAGAGGHGQPAPDPWTRFLPRLATATPILALGSMLVTLPYVKRELFFEQRRFQELSTSAATLRPAFHEEVRAAMLRHPADPYFPLAGGLRATLAHDESVVPWVARALDRNPRYGRAHLLLARALNTHHRAQARLEYRLAYQEDSTLRWAIAVEVSRLVETYEDAMDLVPAGPAAITMLDTLALALVQTKPATAWRIDEQALARPGTATGAIHRHATATLADVREPAPWCDVPQRPCVREALKYARMVRAANPTQCEAAIPVAELMARENPQQALDELDGLINQAPDATACIRGIIEIGGRTGHRARADAAIAKLERMMCREAQRCAENLVFLGETEVSRGNGRRAIGLFKKAYEQSPDRREDVLERIATLATSQGMHGEALDAYTRLAERHPEEGRWKDAALAEREAIQRRAYGSTTSGTATTQPQDKKPDGP